MRDFYHTYANQPELMRKAQVLGWTQNTVSLICCKTDTQRYFYITLAAEKNLSKLALIKEIKRNTFSTAQSDKAAQTAVAIMCHTEGEIAAKSEVCPMMKYGAMPSTSPQSL